MAEALPKLSYSKSKSIYKNPRLDERMIDELSSVWNMKDESTMEAHTLSRHKSFKSNGATLTSLYTIPDGVPEDLLESEEIFEVKQEQQKNKRDSFG